MVRIAHRAKDSKNSTLLKPSFNTELNELWIGDVLVMLVKRLDIRAANQIRILAAFEEEGWQPRIDDPLSPRGHSESKSRLRDTIFNLNGAQQSALIRFFADGSGRGLRWELRWELR